jgi:uncharacterized membrane protein YjfL (UPF0719 family)
MFFFLFLYRKENWQEVSGFQENLAINLLLFQGFLGISIQLESFISSRDSIVSLVLVSETNIINNSNISNNSYLIIKKINWIY